MDMKRARSRFIYRFGQAQAEGDGSMVDELGGKGASLAEMTRLGLPVPAGFTISTRACRFYLEHGTMPPSLEEELESAQTHHTLTMSSVVIATGLTQLTKFKKAGTLSANDVTRCFAVLCSRS